MGQALDLPLWVNGLVTKNPGASKYGQLHLDYASRSRHAQLMSSLLDAVTATLLLGGDSANSRSGVETVFQFREFFCTYNEDTSSLDHDVKKLVPVLQGLFGSLKPENRELVIGAVFQLCCTQKASMRWFKASLSKVLDHMKGVTNKNFGNALVLLTQADLPSQRGARKRAQVLEIDEGTLKKVSGSSIQRSIFV